MNINERINYLFNTYKPVKQRVLEFADIDRKSLRDYMVNGTQPAANTADKIFQFFRDLLFLKWSDIHNGRLVFNRSKTGKPYSILIYPEAFEIIERYAGRVLLLSFMESRLDYGQFLKWINNHFPDITKKVTTYSARHTWATVASSIGISKEVIAAGLTHGGNSVTDIYIDFDLRRVDEANRAVIDAIKKPV